MAQKDMTTVAIERSVKDKLDLLNVDGGKSANDIIKRLVDKELPNLRTACFDEKSIDRLKNTLNEQKNIFIEKGDIEAEKEVQSIIDEIGGIRRACFVGISGSEEPIKESGGESLMKLPIPAFLKESTEMGKDDQLKK
jgi:hypothetical protein